ncbi:hypothetical protein ACT3TD_14600 [Corynebacterium sp. AOP36-E1-14]|uniref:hypothetical protein n=1 Tax=unclassified Corynebacterium TaxID=2624378 RepID=UPI004034E3DD
MITSKTRKNEGFSELHTAVIRAEYAVATKRDRGEVGEVEQAQEDRDHAVHALSAALPIEFKRIAEHAETGTELVAEALMALYPSLTVAQDDRLAISHNEPFSDLEAAYNEEAIAVNAGRLLDDLANNWDELVEKADLSKSAKETATEARRIFKSPQSWSTVVELIAAIRG